MSVDLVATLPRPVPSGVVVDTARAALAELLALAAPPELSVTWFPLDEQGFVIRPGHRLAGAELPDFVLGVPGAQMYARVDAGGEDGAWLMDGEHHPHGDEGVVLSVSPTRTSVGVLLATGIALAAAVHSGGDFIDDEIGMLRPPVREPRAVIARTRLAGPPRDLLSASETYLRQFPHLGGWPAESLG